MPSEWKVVVKVSSATLQQELNALDKQGCEIHKILPAGEVVSDSLYNIVAKKNR